MTFQKFIQLLAILVFTFLIALNLKFSVPNEQEFWDLGSFLLAGWNVENGFPPYSFETRQQFAEIYGILMTGPNVNSPVSLLLFSWFTFFSPQSVLYFWYGAQLCLAVLLTFFLVQQRQELDTPHSRLCVTLFFLCSTGVWYALELLQLYLFLFALVVGTIVLERSGRRLLASGCLGLLVALKPQFVFMLLFLFVSREQRLALQAFAIAGILHLLSGVIYGVAVYLEWFKATKEKGLELTSEFLLQMSLPSPIGSLLSQEVVLFVGVLVLLCYSIFLGRRVVSATLEDKLGLAFAGPLLFLPFAWLGYIVLLFPALIRHFERPLLLGALTVFCMPGYFIYANARQIRALQGVTAVDFFYPIVFFSLVVGLWFAITAEEEGLAS